MKVIIFGATGMVGQGVLRECLLDPQVTEVVSVGRSASDARNPKLREIVHKDFLDYSSIEKDLTGYDACFFCLGVSSIGMDEKRYTAITYDVTLAAAHALSNLNPQMTFVYVTGRSTDSTEKGPQMWARVKGKTENDLLKLPFKAAYMFRPGLIQPMHGVRSKTVWVDTIYTAISPLMSLAFKFYPNSVTTTEQVGRAMIGVAARGYPKSVLEVEDINSV